MTMLQPVDWFGLPISLHIGAGHVGSHHACPYAQNVSSKATITAMTSTCF